jgi:hypothetical protein
MSTEPQQPPATRGVIHIECRHHSERPSEFLISFSGKKGGVGTFWIGSSIDIDAVCTLLLRFGVSATEVETAAQVLMAEPHHEIPNVTLTQAMIRELGL